MANILTSSRRVFTYQPLQFLPVDWQNKYARGVVAFLALPTLAPINAANGKAFSIGTVFPTVNALVAGSNGIALRINGATIGQSANLTLPTSGLSTRSFSFLARLRTTSSNDPGVGARDNGSNILLWRNSGAWDMRVGGQDYTQTGTYSLNTWYNYAITSGPTSAKLYVDNSLIINGGVAGTGTLADLLVGTDPQGGGAHDVEIEWLVVVNRELAAHEVRAIFAAPYQLLVSPLSRTFVNTEVSGTTPVYADSTLSYHIRSLLSSDNGIQYIIRNAIYQDDIVGYALRAAVAQNNDVGYVLREAISRDNVAAYLMRGYVQGDDNETYSIRGLVQANDNGLYNVRGAVTADTSSSYDILNSNSVSNSNTASYSVRGFVGENVVSTYNVRVTASSDAQVNYSVRSTVSRDSSSSYVVEVAESTVFSDLTSAYTVNGIAPSVDYDAIADAVWSHASGYLVERVLCNDKEIKDNQLIIYEDDKTTPLITWDLKDAAGVPTESSVFKSERVCLV